MSLRNPNPCGSEDRLKVSVTAALNRNVIAASSRVLVWTWAGLPRIGPPNEIHERLAKRTEDRKDKYGTANMKIQAPAAAGILYNSIVFPLVWCWQMLDAR
jgi:hypothetical protein